LKAKELYPVNITLLGFKPVSEVFWGDHIKPGMMLVPDDVQRPGTNFSYWFIQDISRFSLHGSLRLMICYTILRNNCLFNIKRLKIPRLFNTKQ